MCSFLVYSGKPRRTSTRERTGIGWEEDVTGDGDDNLMCIIDYVCILL